METPKKMIRKENAILKTFKDEKVMGNEKTAENHMKNRKRWKIDGKEERRENTGESGSEK